MRNLPNTFSNAVKALCCTRDERSFLYIALHMAIILPLALFGFKVMQAIVCLVLKVYVFIPWPLLWQLPLWVVSYYVFVLLLANLRQRFFPVSE